MKNWNLPTLGGVLLATWLVSAAVAQTAAATAATPASESPKATDSLAAKVAKFTALPGLFPLYWDEKKGELWLEVPKLEQDFIYFTSLPGGMGSNDIGLDRGQVGAERIVRFVRSGPKVLLVQPNLDYRASTPDPAERRTVEDSFAVSAIAGFTVEAEEGGRVLLNATDFFLRDGHDVIGTLKATKQGTFALDPKRSAFSLAHTKNFPRNTEVEVTLTFAGTEPGRYVRDVTPDPRSITLRERHSFVQLPAPGFVPRAFDPRAGYFPKNFADYSAPIGGSLVQRLIYRHRLEKKNPGAARSEAVQPIVYYLDPGTPEPIRGALLDGARWWNQAFEAAGFINAFRVELLPADADAQDVRYHTIQWVHRATRGWSYGASISDPRTGEIIKGHVTLGSLRVRQDYLIAEGLLAPYETGRSVSPEMEKMALARLRQLSAHEVGHTLGLAHNYLASTANRASVMDYPHPLALLRADGSIDLSNAYATGIGEWDKVAIACGYTVFPSGTTDLAGIDGILREARGRGLTFLSDQDARPPGGVHPFAHLWDGGAQPVDELARLLQVRAAALNRLGENVIKPGQPLATIEEVLVPVFLGHRYQVEAVVKTIAGQRYAYALRGDGQEPLATVPAADQRRALAALLGTLTPATLRLPAALLQTLPPRPLGFAATRELFDRRTGLAFDTLAPAEAAAELTLALVFHPERATRLVQQNALDPKLPGLEEVVKTVIEATWGAPAGSDYDGEIQRTVNYAALRQLFTLAANPASAPQVQAVVTQQLTELRDRLQAATSNASAAAQRAHLSYGVRQIGRFLENPKDFVPPPAPVIPPGQPIGAACEW